MESEGFHKILVATDFSPASEPALKEAAKLARSNQAELLIAHAYEPPSPLQIDGYVAPWIYNEWEGTLRKEAELALFRALQETLSNVARHAGARAVRVKCSVDGMLVLEITDDGRGLPAGFDISAMEREGHLGLAGMRERIAALGGRVDVTGASPGAGVTVRIELPL